MAYTTLPIFYTPVQGRSSTKRKFPTCENSKVSSMKRNIHQREQFLPAPMSTSLVDFCSSKKHNVCFQQREVKYDSITPCHLRSVPESKHGKKCANSILHSYTRSHHLCVAFPSLCPRSRVSKITQRIEIILFFKFPLCVLSILFTLGVCDMGIVCVVLHRERSKQNRRVHHSSSLV